jgi:death-on-curing protein
VATEPVWVLESVVLAIHDEQIAEHGGVAGVRDSGLLDSALNRPRQRHHYEAAPLPALAASYAYGIIRNHPFLDGNKRTGLVVAELFLALNGWTLTASDADCVLTILKLAAGEIAEEALADWIAANSTST